MTFCVKGGVLIPLFLLFIKDEAGGTHIGIHQYDHVLLLPGEGVVSLLGLPHGCCIFQ